MEVRDGFAAVGAVVDHETKAAGEFEFLGENAGREQQVAEERLVGGRGLAHAGNELFWNDQKMDRSLGLDVVQDDAEVVLVLDLGGDFAVDDALEDGFWHVGRSLSTGDFGAFYHRLQSGSYRKSSCRLAERAVRAAVSSRMKARASV